MKGRKSLRSKPRKSVFGFSTGNKKAEKERFSFYNGAFAAAVLLAVLVIAAELAKPFKDFLASIFTHHWIGKAVLTAAAFLIVGYVYKQDNVFGVKSEKASWYATLGSLAVILLFYVLHFFGG